MKKPCLALYLILSTLGVSVMPNQTAWSAPFFAHDMAKVRVETLDFKHIMRTFYAGRMVQTYVEDESLQDYPHIGLTDKFDEYHGDTLALMHPVLTYKNHQGDTRYLVVIEKVAIKEGSLIGGHAGGAKADLYTFKKSSKGYQLVSKSQKDDGFTGSWGRLDLDLKAIATNMQPLGKDLTGSVFENGYCSTGSCETWWEALLLSENDYIGTVMVAEAGGNNAGMYERGSPLFYSFESTFKVINDGSRHYPIQIHYTGEKPDDDHEHIRQVNHQQTVRFSTSKNQYQ